MTNPDHTTAAAFPRYLNSKVLADSTSLHWPELFVRRCRFPRVVDRLLVPATAEPFITCNVAGSAEFCERDPGGGWTARRIRPGDLFVTRSVTPYEVRFTSPVGEEIENIQIHIAVDPFRKAMEATWPDHAAEFEVIDFFGRDPALFHLGLACGEILAAGAPARSGPVAALTQLLAAYLAEHYVGAAAKKPDHRGGLPIWQLRKIEDHLHDQIAENIAVETLAELVGLSPFHFSRVFKQATGMSPLQFVTRERITRAQQLIRESSRSLIEIALEVGYASPSHFAHVFRRIAGVTPTDFRNALKETPAPHGSFSRKNATGGARSREQPRAGPFKVRS